MSLLLGFLLNPKVWMVTALIGLGAGLTWWVVSPELKKAQSAVKVEKANVQVQQVQTTQTQAVATVLAKGEAKIAASRTRTAGVVAKIVAAPSPVVGDAGSFWSGVCGSSSYADDKACIARANAGTNPGARSVQSRAAPDK